MDSDIKATVDRINQRIDKLTRIRALLLEEFGSDTVEPTAPTLPGFNHVKRIVLAKPTVKVNRRIAISDFLRLHGPATRREIHEQTGIPAGTVSYELNNKALFERLDGNRYQVKAEGETASQ